MFENIVFEMQYSLFGLDDALGALLITTVASSLISGISSLVSTKKTNDKNYEIMQSQNVYNTEQWQREAEYNTEMWNKTNEYNTPENQVKRLQEAGINPYLSLGSIGGSSSDASMVSAPSSAPAAGMEYMSMPYSQLSEGINNSLMTAANYQSQIANKDYLEQHAINETMDTLKKMESMRVSDNLNRAHQVFLEQQTKEMMDTLQYRIGSAKYEMENAEKNGRLIEKQIVYQDTLDNLAHSQIKLTDNQADQIAAITAQSWIKLQDDLLTSASVRGVNASQVSVNRQQVKNLVEDMYNTAADTSIKRIERNTLMRIKNATVDQLMEQVRGMRWQNENPVWSRILPSAGSVAGAAIGAYAGSRGKGKAPKPSSNGPYFTGYHFNTTY